MIHEVNATIRIHDHDDFLYPCYGENCISNIPGTIMDLFDLKTNLPKLPNELGAKNEGANKIVLDIINLRDIVKNKNFYLR